MDSQTEQEENQLEVSADRDEAYFNLFYSCYSFWQKSWDAGSYL